MKSLEDLSKRDKWFIWFLLGVIFICLILFFISWSNPDNHITTIECNGKNHTFYGMDVRDEIVEVCGLPPYKKNIIEKVYSL